MQSLLPKDDNQADDQPGDVLKAFRSFILEFRLDNNFIYRWVVVLRAIGLFWGVDGGGRDALRTNILIKLYMLDVDIAHLISFNEELAHRLSNEPAEILPIVCLSL